jgi:DNA-directed RNA polymerase specialized sigma subunit
MIKSEREYREALRQLEQDRAFAAQQRQDLESMGLTPDEVERAMQPLLSFQAQLEEEAQWYADVRQHKVAAVHNFTEVGRLLIALRIANGLTQRELADRLAVSESVVSRDEKNEYYGITLERAQRILEALQETVSIQV